ncbi:ABC transporter permease [Ensifer aridi]|uniref:ABC transporter permease n=1 Tax=Ensifer aridi TaxID=1708715 RepID=UPI00041C90E7|nr:ABC transporter permease [Ensifer aridi]
MKPGFTFNIGMVLSAGWLLIALAVVLLDQMLVPFGFKGMNLSQRLIPPLFFTGTFDHPLGTDHLGRDMLSRMIAGARYSCIVVVAATVISTVLGVSLGFASAYLKGWIEEAIGVLIDFQAAIPFLIIALTILAFMGSSHGIFVVTLGLLGWEKQARHVRGMVLSQEGRGYVSALRIMGASNLRIYGGHILPNVAPTILAGVILTIPEVLLWESALGFLGFGVQPPATSIGALLAYGRNYMLDAWWLSVLPALFIVFTAASVSNLGDLLQRHIDGKSDRVM